MTSVFVRRGRLAGGVSALALVLLGAGHAGAQTAGQAAGQARGPAADGGDTVVIVGQTIEETLPQELETYGSDVEVTDSEEIRNSGFVDVSQALQMDTPGLFLAPRGGPFSYLDISLQGSRTQDMLFLVDGVRINNRLYSGTITDTLPASMVERIEVLKGGQSLFYGTQAAAGVINVVTRGYTDSFNGQVAVGGDTNDSLHVDGYVRGKAGPGNYVLYASQDKSDGFTTFSVSQPSATDKARSYDVNSYGGKYRLDVLENLAFDARYQHTDARLDYPGARLTAYSKNERDEDIASLGVDWRAATWAQVLVKGYWHDWDSNYTTINNRLPLGSGQTVVDRDTYWGYEDKGVNLLAKLTPGGPLEYVVGYDFQQYSGRDEVLLIAEQTEEVNAVFAQVRSDGTLVENASFAAGVRYNDAGGSDATVWNVSGRYDFSPFLYAQGTAGTSFLLPTAEQLYAIDPCCALGNPKLEPEQSESVNAGLGGAFTAGPAFTWQATYFARNIDDLILDDSFQALGLNPVALYPNLSDPDPSTPENDFFFNGLYYNLPGEVEVTGFELIGDADFGGGWRANASYSDTKARMDGSSMQVARIPRRYAKAGLAYDAPGGVWGLNASVLWTGEQRSNVTVNDGPDPGTAADVISFNYGDYVVADLAAHLFLGADQRHKLTVRLQNLFDEEYLTRVNSGLADSAAAGRFVFGNRGVPQTASLTYSYGF